MPAELPFGHPNYLWPCHGLKPVDGNLAARLRAPTWRARRMAAGGCWRIARRRPRAPATRSRIARSSSRCIPEAIPDMACGACADSSAGCAPRCWAPPVTRSRSRSSSRPGPYNETYFEHAYLARQLGMPLVEGNDLTVRGDTVYLKTLGGLRRVHSILRRLDDDFCDPLELRSDSALGVAGLVGALRAGRVMVANALGTGVLESAAWLGFLPPIAERLIGEKLLLPEVATWWLGEKPALEYVLANLDRLVIKPAYPNQRFEPMFGRDFTGADARRADRASAQPPVCLRGAGARAPVAGAGVEVRGIHRTRGARADHPRLRRDDTRRRARACRAAWRAWPTKPRPTWSRHSAAAAPRTSGCWRRRTTKPQRRRTRAVAAGKWTAGAPGLHSLAPGRKPLLAGPLHRALRKQRAAVAAHAGRAQRCARVSARARGVPRSRRHRADGEVVDALRAPDTAGSAGRRAAPRLVRIAGAQPAVGALLARRGRRCSARCRKPRPRAAAAAKSTSACCCRWPRSPVSPKKT